MHAEHADGTERNDLPGRIPKLNPRQESHRSQQTNQDHSALRKPSFPCLREALQSCFPRNP
jgi:hypothetical protein